MSWPRDRAKLRSVCALIGFAIVSAIITTEAAAMPELSRRWAATAGVIRANLSYTYSDKPPYKRPTLHLTILRRGAVALTEAIQPDPRDPASRAPFDFDQPLRVLDLDNDTDPEVIVDIGSMGRCCAWTRVYRYDRTQLRYVAVDHWWGNVWASYRARGRCLCDLDNDRRPEFVAADDRFAALSYWGQDPIRIWSFDHGRFTDVTRRFPRAIEADADGYWVLWLRMGRRESLAAWVADEYLLDNRTTADRLLAEALAKGRLGGTQYEATANEFVAQLRALLRRAPYALA